MVNINLCLRKMEPGGAVGGRLDLILAASGAMEALLIMVGSSVCIISVETSSS